MPSENPHPADGRSARPLTRLLTAGRIYGTAIVALAVWVLHGFVAVLLAACVTAIASWPLYRRFAARLPRRVGPNASSLIFTALMTVFVLTPMAFACAALLAETHAMLQQIGAAGSSAVPVPRWLPDLPAVGPWIAERWQDELARPGGLLAWTQRTDPTALLGWAQSIGRFTLRHAIIVGFTVLLMFFLYREGQSLADGFGRLLLRSVGARADLYVGLATRAVRASVNSMVVVALFDGVASGLAFALLGVPSAVLWAAITGALAAVPFLGYVAVIALAMRMAMMGTVTAALVALAMGSAILLVGDKIVRPAVARDGVRLRFVWVLMGCLGGFEVLGLVGVVLGPVVLTLARELWEQSVHDLECVDTTAPTIGMR